MDISYYYEILDMGILYEKGGGGGKFWKIGQRKRLGKENLFWLNLLDFIAAEKNGIDCSDRAFQELEKLCNKYRFPYYQKILDKKWEFINSNYKFERIEDEEINIRGLMKALLLEMQEKLYVQKDKKEVYNILRILHNIPRPMHRRILLSEGWDVVLYKDALSYAQGCMDEERRKKYEKYFW